jgi:SAM-dependent methyltransferase
VRLGGEKNEVDIICARVSECDGDDQFDMVSFVNVLEHTYELWVELQRARQYLRPGGLVLIRAQNGNLHSGLFRFIGRTASHLSLFAWPANRIRGNLGTNMGLLYKCRAEELIPILKKGRDEMFAGVFVTQPASL